MTSKFFDLGTLTLSSSGQPNFGSPDLLTLAEELTDVVSGGVEYGPTNPVTCNGTNNGCTNDGNCSSATNTGCKNNGTCLFDQWPE